jgi:hypothetical protein
MTRETRKTRKTRKTRETRETRKTRETRRILKEIWTTNKISLTSVICEWLAFGQRIPTVSADK